MTAFQAFILGAIQGITEFFPISSSGHLILLPYIFGWELQPLSFDIALHLGTLLAVIFAFYKKWWKILKNKRYLALLISGTLPAAIIGFFFEDIIEEKLRSSLVVSLNLIFVAFLMVLAEKFGAKNRGERDLDLKDAMLIGFAQAAALIPGISRSGITITSGLSRNLKRDEAAEFSFILGTPIIFGTGAFKIGELLREPITINVIQTFGVGMITATFFGFLAIKYLLKFLKNHTLIPFVLYRIFLGLILLFLIFF